MNEGIAVCFGLVDSAAIGTAARQTFQTKKNRPDFSGRFWILDISNWRLLGSRSVFVRQVLQHRRCGPCP